jgi:hypothetical protein
MLYVSEANFDALCVDVTVTAAECNDHKSKPLDKVFDEVSRTKHAKYDAQMPARTRLIIGGFTENGVPNADVVNLVRYAVEQRPEMSSVYEELCRLCAAVCIAHGAALLNAERRTGVNIDNGRFTPSTTAKTATKLLAIAPSAPLVAERPGANRPTGSDVAPTTAAARDAAGGVSSIEAGPQAADPHASSVVAPLFATVTTGQDSAPAVFAPAAATASSAVPAMATDDSAPPPAAASALVSQNIANIVNNNTSVVHHHHHHHHDAASSAAAPDSASPPAHRPPAANTPLSPPRQRPQETFRAALSPSRTTILGMPHGSSDLVLQEIADSRPERVMHHLATSPHCIVARRILKTLWHRTLPGNAHHLSNAAKSGLSPPFLKALATDVHRAAPPDTSETDELAYYMSSTGVLCIMLTALGIIQPVHPRHSGATNTPTASIDATQLNRLQLFISQSVSTRQNQNSKQNEKEGKSESRMTSVGQE